MFESTMDWLSGLGGNPGAYLVFLFIFTFLAAVILPIPVELGLIGMIASGFSLFGLSVFPSYLIIALVMGLGKGTGAWLVFRIGMNMENSVRKYMKWRWFKWLMKKSTWLVSKLEYIGLYLLLIIPGMADTIPIYIFSFSNKEGDILETRYFVATNFVAGISRTILVGIMVMSGVSYFA